MTEFDEFVVSVEATGTVRLFAVDATTAVRRVNKEVCRHDIDPPARLSEGVRLTSAEAVGAAELYDADNAAVDGYGIDVPMRLTLTVRAAGPREALMAADRLIRVSPGMSLTEDVTLSSIGFDAPPVMVTAAGRERELCADAARTCSAEVDEHGLCAAHLLAAEPREETLAALLALVAADPGLARVIEGLADLVEVERDGEWAGLSTSAIRVRNLAVAADGVLGAFGRDRAFTDRDREEVSVVITREQLNDWAGRVLTDDEVWEIDEAIPNSAIPEAIGVIADSARQED